MIPSLDLYRGEASTPSPPRIGSVGSSSCDDDGPQGPSESRFPAAEEPCAPDAVELDYDALPYEGGCFDHTHPNRLAVMARLFGLSAPPIETARVLELGCANGENLIPMAAQLPDARFVGTDLSGRQIGAGRRMVQELGLRNIELERRDILAIDASFGRFDYIICHGVFSWVPDAVRAKILEIVRTNLAPTGVAYISYNVYPGWHQRQTAREIMLYAAEGYTDPRERIQAARSALEFVEGSLFEPTSGYGQTLRQTGATVAGSRDAYLYHDYMERNNRPFWFHEFWDAAVSHGLAYVSDTHLGNGLPPDVSEEVRRKLDAFAPDRVRFEQFLDFLRNRMFRQSVLVHGERSPRREPVEAAIDPLFVSGEFELAEGGEADITTSKTMVFVDAHKHSLRTNHPMLKAVLWEIGDVFPGAVEAVVLRARVARRVAGVVASELVDGPVLFGQLILKLVAARAVDLHVSPPPVATALTPRPEASAIGRHMATIGANVPSHRHRQVTLSDLEREVIGRLDGTRTLEETSDDVLGAVQRGELSISRDGEPFDEETLRQMVPALVDRIATRLLRRSLLVG